jgi:sec-independent protein translocase protein TatB
MFDIAPTEFLLVAIVALVVIGPKDLPKAMRFCGYWFGRAQGVVRQFRSGFDSMVREVELQEMEKKWAAENERIMREHPVEPQPVLAGPVEDPADHNVIEQDRVIEQDALIEQHPVMTEKPVVAPDPAPIPDSPVVADKPAPATDKLSSGAAS